MFDQELGYPSCMNEQANKIDEQPLSPALKRHHRGKSCVIPIILRPVIWEDAPFSKPQVLPTNGIPVTRWQDRDEALWDVAKGIREVVKDML